MCRNLLPRLGRFCQQLNILPGGSHGAGLQWPRVLRNQNYLPLPFLGELIIVGLKNNPKTPNSWSFRKYNGAIKIIFRVHPKPGGWYLKPNNSCLVTKILLASLPGRWYMKPKQFISTPIPEDGAAQWFVSVSKHCKGLVFAFLSTRKHGESINNLPCMKEKSFKNIQTASVCLTRYLSCPQQHCIALHFPYNVLSYAFFAVHIALSE